MKNSIFRNAYFVAGIIQIIVSIVYIISLVIMFSFEKVVLEPLPYCISTGIILFSIDAIALILLLIKNNMKYEERGSKD